jgi:serine/threonine protein kinase
VFERNHILQSRYQLLECLGENGGRHTWAATDQKLDQIVVIKILAFPNHIDWQVLKLFEREAEILRTIDHPCIPKYRDFFTLDDRTIWYCLVEDYIPGKSLKQLLDQGTHFPESQLRDIAKQVLSILVYLHSLSPPIYHRDIKPSNLIWGEDDRVYLVDFGAVQDKAPTMGITFTVVGTYGYTPIEQFAGRAVPSSDLYALGATIVHLATGRSPADLPQENFRLQFLEYVTLPIPLLQWLTRMVEPEASQRFQRADRALEALEIDSSVNWQNQGRSRRTPPQRVVPKPLGTKISVQNTGERLVISTDPIAARLAMEATLQAVPSRKKALNTLEIFVLGIALFFIGSILAIITPLFAIVSYAGFLIMVFALLYGIRDAKPNIWTIALDQKNYMSYENRLGKIDRQSNYHRGSLSDIQEVIHHGSQIEQTTQEEPYRITISKRVVTIRTSQTEIPFGESLTRQEAEWIVFELRSWLSQHT